MFLSTSQGVVERIKLANEVLRTVPNTMGYLVDLLTVIINRDVT